MISIIVAFPKIEDANKIKSLLVKSGFSVQGVCASGALAIQMAGELDGGIVISSCKLPDMTCQELNQNLPITFKLLVLASKRVWSTYGGDNIMFVEMPVKVHELTNTIEMIIRARERARKKVKGRTNFRNDADKELIMKAKLMLMDKNNLSEEDAYRYIQKNSMDSGNSMVDTAAMLLNMMNM